MNNVSDFRRIVNCFFVFFKVKVVIIVEDVILFVLVIYFVYI